MLHHLMRHPVVRDESDALPPNRAIERLQNEVVTEMDSHTMIEKMEEWLNIALRLDPPIGWPRKNGSEGSLVRNQGLIGGKRTRKRNHQEYK